MNPALAPLHQMIGAAVMNHLSKHAANGSMQHATALNRLMALHHAHQIGLRGMLYHAAAGQMPHPGGMQMGQPGQGY